VKHKWVAWVSLALLIVAVAGGSSYFKVGGFGNSTGQSTDAPPAVQEAVARRGSLTVTASGAGSLSAVTQINLGFTQGGVVTELYVAPGEHVKAGERLARLQVNKSAAQLEADVTAAQLAVISAQQKLDQLYADAQVQTAQAQVALEQAQNNLEDLTNSGLAHAQAQQALAQARQAVQQAEMELYILNSKPSEQAIQVAKASLLFKQKDLQTTLDQIAKLEFQIKKAPNKTMRDRLKSQLLNMQVILTQKQDDYNKRLYRLEHMSDPSDPLDVAAAQASLQAAQMKQTDAQRFLDALQDGPSPGDIAIAQAKLKTAQDRWDQVKDGPDPKELELAQAQLVEAQARLAVAKQEQQYLDLVAPRNGRVLSVNTVVGNRIGGGALITLVDDSQLQVQANMDESDLPNLKAGQMATVTFDALPGQSFDGQVISINPSLANVRGASAVTIQVQLDPSALLTLQDHPLGLSASVDVVVGQVTNAVIVPLEALQQQADGSYAVTVMRNGQPQLQKVTVGLSDYTSAAITSGLNAGEIVAWGSLQTSEGAP
jgi:multidrug efflux pump subunit AcrA (membrane-fusion protein)